MKIPQQADMKSCTGCLGCIDICPQNAIVKTKGSDGHVYVTVDGTLCVGCLKCERFCKKLHDGRYADNSTTSASFVSFPLYERKIGKENLGVEFSTSFL